MASLKSLVKWTKDKLLRHFLFRRMNDKFLNLFLDLPGSFSWGGFMDRLELSDVCLDTTYITYELYKSGIPVRLKYGHIGTLKLNLYFTAASSHIILEDVLVVLAPHVGWSDPAATIDANLKSLRQHLQDNLKTFTSSPTQSPSDEVKFDINLLINWLFRYNPHLTISVKNIHIRYEDDVLCDGHALGLICDRINVKPSPQFWEFQWPSESNPHELFLGHLSRQDPQETRSCPLGGCSNHTPIQETLVPPDCATPTRVSMGTGMSYENSDEPEEVDDPQTSAQSIFTGLVKGLGIYVSPNYHRIWVPSHLLAATDASRGAIYKLLPVLEVQQMAKRDMKDYQWLLNPFDCSLQFGLQSCASDDFCHSSDTCASTSLDDFHQGDRQTAQHSSHAQRQRVGPDSSNRRRIGSTVVQHKHESSQHESSQHESSQHESSCASSTVVQHQHESTSTVLPSCLASRSRTSSSLLQASSTLLRPHVYYHLRPHAPVSNHLPPQDPRASIKAGQFLLRVPHPIQVTLDPETLSTAIRIHHHCTKQFERWKLLRQYRPMILSQYTGLSSRKKLLAKQHWNYCKTYLSILRRELGHPCLNFEVSTRIAYKRRFCRLIRLWLLQYHLTHPKGILKASNQGLMRIPLIDASLRLLSSDFVLNRNPVQTLLSKLPSSMNGSQTEEKKIQAEHRDPLPIPWSPSQATTSNRKNYEPMRMTLPMCHRHGESQRGSDLCTDKDFEELGFSGGLAPIGYFFLLPYSKLKDLSSEDPNIKFLLEILHSKSPTTVSQWYLLAVREAEEILCLLQRMLMGGSGSFPQTLRADEAVERRDTEEPTKTHQKEKLGIEDIDVCGLAEFLHRDESFTRALHQALKLEKPPPKLLKRIKHSPLWFRTELKNEIAADFYDAYVSHFPGIPCENVDLRSLFAFKDRLVSDRNKNPSTKKAIESVLLDHNVAKPAIRIVSPPVPSSTPAVVLKSNDECTGNPQPAAATQPLHSYSFSPSVYFDHPGSQFPLKYESGFSSTKTTSDPSVFPLHREVPLESLIGDRDSRFDPVVRTLMEEGGYCFPKWLWNLSLGCWFSTLEIRLRHQDPNLLFKTPSSNLRVAKPSQTTYRANHASPSEAIKKQKHSFDLALRSIGLQLRLQHKVTFTAVCQQAELINVSFPYNGFPAPDAAEMNQASKTSKGVSVGLPLASIGVTSGNRQVTLSSIEHPVCQPHVENIIDSPLFFLTPSERRHCSIDSERAIEIELPTLKIPKAECSDEEEDEETGSQNKSTSALPDVLVGRFRRSSSTANNFKASHSGHHRLLTSTEDSNDTESSDLQNPQRRSNSASTSSDPLPTACPFQSSSLSYRWSYIAITLMTRQMMERQQYRVELPLFMVLQVHPCDIHIEFRPEAFDGLRKLLLSLYVSWMRTKSDTETQLLEWTSAKHHQGRQIRAIDYQAKFAAQVLPLYFPCPAAIQGPERIKFWSERLRWLLAMQPDVLVPSSKLLQSLYPRLQSLNSQQRHRTSSLFHPHVHSLRLPSLVSHQPPTSGAAVAKCFGLLSQSNSQTANQTNVNEEMMTNRQHKSFTQLKFDAAVEKSQFSLYVRFPSITVTIFSFVESETAIELAQLQIASDCLTILSGRRRNGGLHLVAKTNRMKFATRTSLQDCITFYTICRRVFHQRKLDFLNLIQQLDLITELQLFTPFAESFHPPQEENRNVTSKSASDSAGRAINLLMAYFDAFSSCQETSSQRKASPRKQPQQSPLTKKYFTPVGSATSTTETALDPIDSNTMNSEMKRNEEQLNTGLPVAVNESLLPPHRGPTKKRKIMILASEELLNPLQQHEKQRATENEHHHHSYPHPPTTQEIIHQAITQKNDQSRTRNEVPHYNFDSPINLLVPVLHMKPHTQQTHSSETKKHPHDAQPTVDAVPQPSTITNKDPKPITTISRHTKAITTTSRDPKPIMLTSSRNHSSTLSSHSSLHNRTTTTATPHDCPRPHSCKSHLSHRDNNRCFPRASMKVKRQHDPFTFPKTTEIFMKAPITETATTVHVEARGGDGGLNRLTSSRHPQGMSTTANFQTSKIPDTKLPSMLSRNHRPNQRRSSQSSSVDTAYQSIPLDPSHHFMKQRQQYGISSRSVLTGINSAIILSDAQYQRMPSPPPRRSFPHPGYPEQVSHLYSDHQCFRPLVENPTQPYKHSGQQRPHRRQSIGTDPAVMALRQQGWLPTGPRP